MFTKTFLFLALLSVVSSQTFNRRSRFRSGNFRRFQDDGALDENGGSANGGASNGFSSQLTDEAPAPQYGGSEQATLDGGAGGAVDEAGVTDGGTGDGGELPLEPTGDAALDGAGPDAGAGEGGADLTATDRDSDEPTANLADDGGAGGVAAPPPPSTPSNGHGAEEEEHDPNDLSWLRNAIRGEPDQDYPILADIPKTGFRCSDQQYAGYYGDPADPARCQVFHICQKPDNRMDSFLCPNGTIFSQRHFVCVWWWQYDCANTEKDYALNANLYAEGGSDAQNNQLQDVGAGGDTAGDGYGSTAPGDEVTEAPALGGTLDGEAGFTDTAGGDENGLTTSDGGAGDIPATGTDEETGNGVDTTADTGADENGALQGGTADGYSKTTQTNGANVEARAVRRGAIRRGSRVSSLRLRSRSRSSSRRRSLRRRGSSRSRSRSSSRRSSRSRVSRRRSLRRVSSSRRRRNSRRGATRRSRVSRRNSRRISRFRN